MVEEKDESCDCVPQASVIVVNWNRNELLKECLESLTQQTFRHFEIIVVDNGSTDGSVELVRQHFAHVRLITLSENFGFAIGNNIGIRRARGKYIVLLNNDAVAEPGWLEALVSAIEQRPEVGSCASKILFYDRRHLINSTGILFFSCGIAMDRSWMAQSHPELDAPDYTVGACAAAALYRKSMLDEIGLFDEDFSPAYFEDVDLSLRAQLRGYRCLYVPSAVVYHHFAATLGYRSFAAEYLGVRNQWYALVKDVPGRLLIKYGTEIFGYLIFKFLVLLVKREAKPYLLGHQAALKKLPLMMKKRVQTQSLRSISVTEFELLMTKGRLKTEMTRLFNRLCGRPTDSRSMLLPQQPGGAS